MKARSLHPATGSSPRAALTAEREPAQKPWTWFASARPGKLSTNLVLDISRDFG